MPKIPYIDPATLKSQIDRLIPLIVAVDRFVPGSIEFNTALGVLQNIVDNDNVLIPVVELINKISGAQPPV